MQDSFIYLKNLCKSYRENQNRQERLVVLENISINVRKGEFVTILGPNGCGKSTLLNIIAGLIEQDSGEIIINGKSPQQAHTGYVFQNYPQSLLPWKRVIDNIAFPLEIQGTEKHERRQAARTLVSSLGLDIPLQYYPYQLSGGQQQMTVVAKSLIHHPDLLLMDEPFSSMNFQIRLFMQDKIQEIWGRTGITLLFVSHEIEEAIYMADRIVVLTKKPTQIAGIFDVPLSRPRTHSATVSKEFVDLKKNILDVINCVIE